MLEKINAILWAITTVFMIIFGIYFTLKLKFPQFKIVKIFKSLKNGTLSIRLNACKKNQNLRKIRSLICRKILLS